MEWDTVRSLANCHDDGKDPSPQVILIFSPEILLGDIPGLGLGTGHQLCTPKSGHNADHAWGVNTPNFVVISTSTMCGSNFDALTSVMAHEIVETVSDQAGWDAGFHARVRTARRRTSGRAGLPAAFASLSLILEL
jgi:hypothetical protein